MNKFVYIWEYEIKKAYIEEFFKYYNSSGEWVNLFKKNKGYKYTELLISNETSNKFISIDYWDSESDYKKFLKLYMQEIQEMDKLCEKFTLNEKKLGEFQLIL